MTVAAPATGRELLTEAKGLKQASGQAAALPSPTMNVRRFTESPRRLWPTAFPGW
jgi:hypothetical protein